VIYERCSCGARVKTDQENALAIVREWRKKHQCIEPSDIIDLSPTSGVSDNQLTIGFAPGEIPAKKYDPWEE